MFLMPHLLSLPSEIISEITILLFRKDLLAFSLLSLAARQLAVPSLFRNVCLQGRRGAGSIKESCKVLHAAGDRIKHAIK